MKKIIKAISILFLFVTTGYLASGQSKPRYQLPHFDKVQLPNGLVIYLMEKHDVPIISLDVIVPAGAVNDGEQAGLASLTGTCLKCGTKSFTKKKIEERFDFLGADLNTTGSNDKSGLSAKFAAKDQDKLLPMIKEMLVNPVFSDEEFNKEKKLALIGLDQAKESPGAVIGAYWNKLFYGKNIYGNVVSGTVSSLTPLTANDARNFYKKYYNPAGAAIAVVGDFKTNEMKAALTKLFSEWKKTSPVTKAVYQPEAAPGNARILLVNKDDALETTLFIGGAGITRNNPDYLPVQVINTFFGGKFTSWMNNELRIKSGLTYGAGSYFDYNQKTGSFIISTHTANATTQATIDKALEVINRLHTHTIDEETLSSAKNYLIGMSPPQFQSTDELAGLLIRMFWYGFDESYINNFETNVNAVTVAKANEIIAKYFPKNNLQFVLIGKASEIKPIAEKYGKVTVVELKDDIGKGF
ncbi:MAG: insulinase family protein [Bacteroidota bacterium]|nr:insulinase family protein [Bacteroidota bacterium]